MKLSNIVIGAFGIAGFIYLVRLARAETVPKKRYKCVNYQCVEDPNGPYDSLLMCQSACISPVLTSILVSPSSSTINVGATKQLTAICKDQNENTITCPILTWSSSNTSIATVDSAGLVTGIGAGTATITSKSGSISGIASTIVTSILSQYTLYKSAGTVYVKDADGSIVFSSSDVVAALIYVNTNIIDNGTLTILEDSYTLSSQTTFTKSMKMIGQGTVIFNNILSGTEKDIITFSGSILSTPNISTNVTKGSNTVTVVSAGSVQPGDLIVVKDPQVTYNPYVPEYSGIKLAEMHLISAVSGNTITVVDGMLYNYPTSHNSFAYLIRPITVLVDNIQIIAPTQSVNYCGLLLSYTKDSIVQNCTFKKNARRQLSNFDCYNTTFQNNRLEDSNIPDTGYLISTAYSSAYTLVQNNTFGNARHCYASGGGTMYTGGQPREIIVKNNTFNVTSALGHLIDAHAIVESFYVYDNIVNAPTGRYAIGTAAKKTIIKGNTIHGGYGIRFRNPPLTPYYIEITGNTLVDSAVLFTSYDANWMHTPHEVVIKNNKVTTIQSSYPTINTLNIKKLAILENNISSSYGDTAIYLSNCQNGLINNNIISNSNTNGSGIVEVSGSNYNTIRCNDLSEVITAVNRLKKIGSNTVAEDNKGVDVDILPDYCKTTIIKYKCTGAPNYQCIEDPNGSFNTLEECLTVCKEIPPSQNLAKNPGFELGTTSPTDYYTRVYDNLGEATFIWATDHASSGDRSIETTSTTTDSSKRAEWHSGYEIPIIADTTYKATVHIHIHGTLNRGARLRATYWSAYPPRNGTMVGDMISDFVTSSDEDWHTITIEGIVPTGAINARLEMMLYGSGSVWFDNLSFEKI